jgi:hypothetical protein
VYVEYSDLKVFSNSTLKIFGCDETVFVMDNDHIGVYLLPPLQTPVSGTIVPTSEQSALMVLAQYSDEDDHAYMIERCSWSAADSAMLNSSRFDVVTTNSEGEISAISHYELTPVGGNRKTCLSASVPLSPGVTELSDLGRTHCYKSAWTTAEEMVFFTINEECIMASILTSPRHIPANVVSGVLWTSHGDVNQDTEFEICPFTGRLCMVEKDDGHYLDIRVMDYLASPRDHG